MRLNLTAFALSHGLAHAESAVHNALLQGLLAYLLLLLFFVSHIAGRNLGQWFAISDSMNSLFLRLSRLPEAGALTHQKGSFAISRLERRILKGLARGLHWDGSSQSYWGFKLRLLLAGVEQFRVLQVLLSIHYQAVLIFARRVVCFAKCLFESSCSDFEILLIINRPVLLLIEVRALFTELASGLLPWMFTSVFIKRPRPMDDSRQLLVSSLSNGVNFLIFSFNPWSVLLLLLFN